MATCYFNPSRPTTTFPEPVMTPPPEDVDCSDLEALPSSGPVYSHPATPESLPSSIHSGPYPIRVTIPRDQQQQQRQPLPQNQYSPERPSPCRRRSSTTLPNPDLTLSTRPYEPILTEQAYLSAALRTYTQRAVDLIRTYAAVDEQLQDVEACEEEEGNGGITTTTVPKQRRRLKKRLSLLKGQLRGIQNQQRALAVRLGELSIELQSHYIWTQTQIERHCPSPVFSPHPPTPTTPLDATSPVFVPHHHHSCSGGGFDALEKVEEEEVELAGGCDSAIEFVEEKEEGNNPECECPRRGSCGGESSSPKEKRLSLPSMSFTWT